MEHYLQKGGTVIGSQMALNYAGLFMALFEYDMLFGPNDPSLTHIKLVTV